MLTSPQSGKLLDPKYIERCLIARLEDLAKFISEKGMCKIMGSSLFFVGARDYYDEADKYDGDIKIVNVTLIDFCHMELFKEGETPKKDCGFIKGIEETVKLLKEIIFENVKSGD